jgi:hypothetical protein
VIFGFYSIYFLVEITENEWNQFKDYIIHWHLAVKEDLDRMENQKIPRIDMNESNLINTDT